MGADGRDPLLSMTYECTRCPQIAEFAGMLWHRGTQGGMFGRGVWQS